MNIGRPEEDRVTQSDYAGRATANSPEWPEVFTIKGVAKVKHPASGQPYRVSRQSVDWKQVMTLTYIWFNISFVFFLLLF